MNETHGVQILNTPDLEVSDARPAQRRLVVIIPAYNEDRFIGSVVLEARRYTDTVIVVDDGSVDGTQAIAEAAGARVIRHLTNQGKGAALKTGLETARALDAGVVVFMDADGQHNPADIPAITSAVFQQHADIVIGSRFLRYPNRAPTYRRIGQRLVTLLTNLTSGVAVTDSWSGFRALSHRAAELISFQETGWGIEPEIQFQASKHGLKVVDVAIDVTYRGSVKRNPVLQGLKTVNGILRLVARKHPLLVLWGAGVLGALVGARACIFWLTTR